MKFSGFLAWLMWRTVYLLKLPRLPKKLRVVTGWTLDLLFSRDLEQMLTMRDVEAMTQMTGRVRKLVAQRSTAAPPAERTSSPISTQQLLPRLTARITTRQTNPGALFEMNAQTTAEQRTTNA